MTRQAMTTRRPFLALFFDMQDLRFHLLDRLDEFQDSPA